MARFVVVCRVTQVMDDPTLLRADDAVTAALANITIAATKSTASNKGGGQVFGASSSPGLVEAAMGGPSGPGGAAPAMNESAASSSAEGGGL